MSNIKEIMVETPLGTLTAQISSDPNYPGVYVYLKPTNSELEIDLAYVEVDKEAPDKVITYLYTDPMDDQFTKKYSIHKDEIVNAVKEYDCGYEERE